MALIEEETARLNELDAGRRAQMQSERRANERVLSNLNDDIAAEERSMYDTRVAYDSLADQRPQFEDSVRIARREVDSFESQLRMLESSKGDRLKQYHEKMPSVVRLIQSRANLFEEMPVGPLGLYVSLEDKRWTDIIENIFGRSLNGFAVTNYRDIEQLNGILKECGWCVSKLIRPII